MTVGCLTCRFPSGAAVGPGPTLGTDFHTRLNVAETASLLQKMPLGTLDWIEEPIRDEVSRTRPPCTCRGSQPELLAALCWQAHLPSGR